MDPWWKRPSPADREAGSETQGPPQLGDSLDVSEHEEISDDKAQRQPRKRRGRRRRGRRSAKRAAAIYCDVESLSAVLVEQGVSSSDTGPTLDALFGATSGPRIAYTSKGEAQQELQTVLEGLEFELVAIADDVDQRNVALALDILEQVMRHGDSKAPILFIARDPALQPLIERLRQSDRRVSLLTTQEASALATAADERVDLLPTTEEKTETARTQTARTQTARTQTAKTETAKTETAKTVERTPEKASFDDPFSCLHEALGELAQGPPTVLWGTLLRQQILRSHPSFDETRFGFDSFRSFLEEAERRDLVGLAKIERSGTYLIASWAPPADS